MHQLFTYIENDDLRLDSETKLSEGGHAPGPGYFTGIVDIVRGRLKTMICPSDRIESGDKKDRMISYGCNGGLPDNYAGDIAANGLDWPQNGALDARFPGIKPTPVPKIHPRPSIGSISQADGTSNTILFGENSDLDVWDHPRTEVETSILWQDGLNSNAVGQILNKPPKANGVDVPLADTIGDLYIAQP